ncbi:hypothetical protein PFLUV_G00186660 [Perca fluviatilis]|uniref:CARD domain-containing protein n=1 Tax=Perca fluviatilis TaxID=8168 RepID=A0A6A5E607_PERFL|nr:hypothetical protein PFLUV_G00186660 [Perca fluviatilis]
MDPVEAVKPKKKTEKQDVSLKTALSSKTSKTTSAAVQTGRIQIMEIKMTNKTNTHLEVEFNDRRQTVYVTTRLLANTFGIKVDDDLERRLRSQMPVTAEATLQGNKITDITNLGPSEAIPAEDSVPAEEKLCTVRTKFVKGVSDANLNQLLDKLLERCVINDEEMQTVRTKSRAEKARDLIDTVRRKGTKASSLLIHTLCEVDLLLSENLKLI